MRPNQNFFNKTPQNPFGQQTTPPGYAHNQRVPKKSSLELFMENYVMNQSKQLQELKIQTGFLNDSLVKLTSKVDYIVTDNKMLETQISQAAQQVSQTKTNQINAITLRNGRQLEDPVGKPKTSKVVKESNEPQGEEAIGESEKPIVPTPYQCSFY